MAGSDPNPQLTARRRLAHALKLRFGLPPHSPNDAELALIIAEVSARLAPSTSDWREAVEKHVPDAGTYFYGGADNSDINALLDQILAR